MVTYLSLTRRKVMTWTVDNGTYTFYNPEGQAMVKTSDFECALMIISEYEKEKRDAKNRDG